jgi:hypothetical protein
MLWERRPGWQKHKVATEGKGLAPAIAAAWDSLWSIAAIDSRPLLLGFSLCAGVVVYFSLSTEPSLYPRHGGAGRRQGRARNGVGDSGVCALVSCARRHRPLVSFR